MLAGETSREGEGFFSTLFFLMFSKLILQLGSRSLPKAATKSMPTVTR